MGARIIEILVALKGPDSLIDVYEQIATGKSFSQAFELVYGISYEAAKPIITSIVVLLEISALNGRARIEKAAPNIPVYTLVTV